MNTTWTQLKQWPPTSTTVIGFGVLAGWGCYLATGSVEMAVFALGAFKVLCPQDAAAIDTAIAEDRKIATMPKAAIAMLLFGVGLALTACNLPAPATSSGAPAPAPVTKLGSAIVATDGKAAAFAAKAQPGLVSLCNAAMALSGLAGPAAPWILGGCSTAEAIDKLAADPTSSAWVQGLIAKAGG